MDDSSANTDLVVEIHMQPSGKPESVQPSIGLYFGDAAPTQTPAMLRLGRQSIDIPPGDQRYTITDSYTVPVDVRVEALQPHAHYRARDIRGEATLPDGSKRELIHIRRLGFPLAARLPVRHAVLAAERHDAVDGYTLRQLRGQRAQPRAARRSARAGVSDRRTRWATCGSRC